MKASLDGLLESVNDKSEKKQEEKDEFSVKV